MRSQFLPRRRNATLQIALLHLQLLLDAADATALYPRRDVEVCPQPRVLLQLVFVVRFYPVDASVAVGEVGHARISL